MKKILLALVFLIGLAASAEATTRYVIPGVGSTGCSNGGTNYDPLTNTCGGGSATVYTTIAGCLNSFGLAAGAGAGHACAVRAGTYAVVITNIMPGGTSAAAMFDFFCFDTAFSCRVDPGAHSTDVLRVNTSNAKFFRVRGFEFDARDQSASQNIISHGNLSTITGIVYENNWLRGGALSGPCLATAELNSNFTIRFNLIEGCMGEPTGGSGSHGMYLKATGGNYLVEHNTIRDVRGMGIQCYPHCNTTTIRKNFIKGAGARAIIVQDGSGVTIDSNIFVANGDHVDSDSVALYVNGVNNAKVLNNVFYNHQNPAVQVLVAATGVELRNNISFSNEGSTFLSGSATQSNNLTANPGMTNPAGDDFSLTSAATTAINQGTNVSGFLSNGAARDIGPFETFTCTTASVTGNNIDITCGMNLNTPLLPASGMTGFTVNNSRNVTAAVRLSDSIIRLTFDGAACTGGQTWTFSYSAGNVTDSALIGRDKNQPLHAITNQAVTNACTGGGGPSPPAGLHVHYKLNENTGTNANDETANNLDGTLVGSPAWVAGKEGSAVYMAANEGDSISVPYGNAVNLTTQSVTYAIGVLPDSDATAGTYTVLAAPGSSTRAQISSISGTWSLGVQANAPAVNTEFPVTATWSRLCVNFNSTTDTATLHVNGVAGTSAESIKTYTSFALAGNLDIGKRSGVTNVLGFAVDDFKLWTSVESCADDYAAWSPPPPASTGTFTQVAYQFYFLRKDAAGSLIKLPNIASTANTAVNASTGAVLTIEIQTNCDNVANCSPIGQVLQFDVDGSGIWSAVPDSCVGKACFYGSSDADASIPTGTPTCPLSGALNCVDGGTQQTASAVPVVDLGQNNSTVNRYLVKVLPVAGEVLRFRLADQNGNALGTYSQYPTVTGVNPSGTGF